MGEVEANRLQQEVMNQQAQAGLFGMQGRQAVTGSYYRAGGTLMSGMGKAMGGFKSPNGGGGGGSSNYARYPDPKRSFTPMTY